jgi:predicted dehydrogenase
MNGIGNATFAVVDSTYCVQAATGPRTAFHGSAGTLILNERGAEAPIELYREDERLDIRGWLPVQVEGGRIGWFLASGVEHLADCIREGRRLLISAEHARHCLELMLKAMEAARTGMAQELTTTF